MTLVLLLLLATAYFVLTALDLFQRRHREKRTSTRIHIPDDRYPTEG